jgi:hypothetical protein
MGHLFNSGLKNKFVKFFIGPKIISNLIDLKNMSFLTEPQLGYNQNVLNNATLDAMPINLKAA